MQCRILVSIGSSWCAMGSNPVYGVDTESGSQRSQLPVHSQQDPSHWPRYKEQDPVPPTPGVPGRDQPACQTSQMGGGQGSNPGVGMGVGGRRGGTKLWMAKKSSCGN